jgi:hypothetical protein
VISVVDPPLVADHEETFAQDGLPVWYLDKHWGFDPRTFVRLACGLDCVGSHAGAALLLYLQVLEQRAPSPDKHERLR